MSDVNTVIFAGYQEYLEINCEITSKKNQIFLIGDDSLKKLDKIQNVNYIDAKKYLKDERIDYFKSFFKPYNTTPEKYVWLWYLRIFIMDLFIKENNIKTIFHIDSDNILFENINDFIFDENNAYLINANYIPTHLTASIHCGLLDEIFFNQFIKLWEDIFINKSKFYLIENKIKYHQINGKGGICDMTLFYLLHSEKILQVQNLMKPVKSKINGEDYFFMDNFPDPEGDLDKNQFKTSLNKKIKLFTKNNNILLYDKIRKKKFHLINIHFQGSAKKFMNKEFLNKYL